MLAAASSANRTNAAIGSHTIRGAVAAEQLNIIEKRGCRPEQFIWIHTNAEPDFSLYLEMAKRGAWLEYDGIGSGDDEVYVDKILRILDLGYGKQLLLSQDRGWYDPAVFKGGKIKPFTYIVQVFLQKLISAGIDKDTLKDLFHGNPFRAFARG